MGAGSSQRRLIAADSASHPNAYRTNLLSIPAQKLASAYRKPVLDALLERGASSPYVRNLKAWLAISLKLGDYPAEPKKQGSSIWR